MQQILLGSSEFAERMLALIHFDPATVKDIPRQQRSLVAKPIFPASGSDQRNALIPRDKSQNLRRF